MRNVRDHLPEKMRGPVAKRMRAAYHAGSALEAQALLEALARELDKTHPGAAGSLREGMAETLTVLRLDLPPTLARTLRSTNAIVIWRRYKGVHHVVHGVVPARDLRFGRGYLPPSMTQRSRRTICQRA